MELKIEDYLGRRRDTQRERELASRLRQLPEATRHEYIQQILQSDVVVGLELANACLRDKSYFVALLQEGLQTADASSIRLWLEAVVSRLGFRRVVDIVAESLESNPIAVYKALYWLPRFLPPNDNEASLKLQRLEAKFKQQEVKEEVAL